MAGSIVNFGDGRVAYISVIDSTQFPPGGSEPGDRVGPADSPDTTTPAPIFLPPDIFLTVPPRREKIGLPSDVFLLVPPGPRLSPEEIEDITSQLPLLIEVDVSALTRPHLDLSRFVPGLERILPTAASGHYVMSPEPDWSVLEALGIRVESPESETE